MIIRYLVVILIILLFIVLGFSFIKDLGDNRKNIDRIAREKQDKIKKETQELFKQGPKRKR